MLQEVRSNGMESVSDYSLSRVIDNEYHALSDNAALTKMGVFDLIQHCADLFEQVVKSRDTKEGLRLYVRAYLVFTYFITTYIMVHFQGFARFMETNHTDFVIYLNLYDFFHSTNVLGPEEFGVDLHVVRCSVLGYLSSRDLLSFDTGDLFGWLNDYVAYYREKSDQEEESTHSQENSDYEAYYRALEDSDDESSLHGQDRSSTNESVPEYASVHSLSTHSVHTALPLKSDKSDAASNCASDAESDVESDFSAPISNNYSSHHSLSSLKPEVPYTLDPRVSGASKTSTKGRVSTAKVPPPPPSISPPPHPTASQTSLHTQSQEQEKHVTPSQAPLQPEKAYRKPPSSAFPTSFSVSSPAPSHQPPPVPQHTVAHHYSNPNSTGANALSHSYREQSSTTDNHTVHQGGSYGHRITNSHISHPHISHPQNVRPQYTQQHPPQNSEKQNSQQSMSHVHISQPHISIPRSTPQVQVSEAYGAPSSRGVPYQSAPYPNYGSPSNGMSQSKGPERVGPPSNRALQPNGTLQSNGTLQPNGALQPNGTLNQYGASQGPYGVPYGAPHGNQQTGNYYSGPQNYGNQQFVTGSSHLQPHGHTNSHHYGHSSQGNGHHSHHTQTTHGNGNISKTQWMRDNGVCGLKNLGSSCYINSTIQVLVGVDRFNSLFYRHANEWLTSRMRSSLAEAMVNLVATFNINGGSNIAPTKFLKVLARLKPDFNVPNEQQDAQELLLFLLDRLHEDLATKPVSSDVDYIALWDIDVEPRDREEYLTWYRGLIKYQGESPVNDMCQGHVQSRLICNRCGHRSVSYSPFTILSLPIPHTNNNGVDLTDCLRYYTQDEVLSGENAWKCPKCDESSDATKESPMDAVFQQKKGMFRFNKRSKSPSKKTSTSPQPPATSITIKQLSFIKLPPVLFIHLSRFSFNLTDKVDTDIAYPMRLQFNHHEHEITYNLRGFINHYGTLKSGHYTSLVKKNTGVGADGHSRSVWCSFDDDHVGINVTHGDGHNKVHSRDVYVLCYERV